MSDEIQNARLSWDSEGQPVSSEFGDVYFSKANGLEETRHVFLQHNQLAERWAALIETSHFTIAETGFGSGLNFLAAWDLWLKSAPASAQLHFVSVEKFPLSKPDLERVLALWPELSVIAQQLITAYPVFVGTGFHRLVFMGGRIKLTLIIDDAAIGLRKLLASTHPLFTDTSPKVDAWFLDGFAPSKNPQMWSTELFTCINSLSKQGTTAATFSAAALVKNGLQTAGFTIQKVAGFGRKRDMLKAFFNAKTPVLVPEDFSYRGRFSPYPVPWTIETPKPVYSDKRALIIGGGLAGCHTARALAERGWKVHLLERHAALAQEGSGNPQGVLYAKLSPMEEAQAAFNLSSLQYALQFYRPLWSEIGSQCGVLQLAHKPSEAELQRGLAKKFSHAEELVQFLPHEQASKIAGVTLQSSGIFFPQAGWINPGNLCTWLVNHSNIQVSCNAAVNRLEQSDSGWQVLTDSGTHYDAPVAIIATAKDAVTFGCADHLPLKAIRGQISYLPSSITATSINTVICAEGYVSPAQNGIFCTGATFDSKDIEADLRISDHQTNLDNLENSIPGFSLHLDASQLKGRVAFRCALPDYLPCVGALPRVEQMVKDFAPLRKNARAGITTGGSYWHGLYINVGHGARGLAYTPLCAELLASHINDEPAPVPRDLVNALHPARFIIRDLARGKR